MNRVLFTAGLALASCTVSVDPEPAPMRAESTEPVWVTALVSSDPGDDGPRRATVSLALDAGLSTRDAGIPGCIVQLDVPEGVELLGDRVLTFEALRDNEFLMEPWERLLDGTELEVLFRAQPGLPEGTTLGINVVGYVSTSPGKDDRFVRQRLELPLGPGSHAVPGDPDKTSWGPFGGELDRPAPLAIGEVIPEFSLPRLGAAGPWSSDEGLGAGPALIVTYRGHW